MKEENESDWHMNQIDLYHKQYSNAVTGISRGIEQYQPNQSNPYSAYKGGLGMMRQLQQNNTHQYNNFTVEELDRIMKELNLQQERDLMFKNNPIKKYPRRKLNIAMK